MRPVRSITVCSLVAVISIVAMPAPASAASRSGRMIAHVNKVRAQHGLGPLRKSRRLNRSARRFSYTMMSGSRFGHAGGVRASGFKRLGEALAMQFGRRLAIGATVRRWLRSPSHRSIVLTRSMRWAGASATRGRFGRRRAVIWVLQTGS